MSAPMVPFYPMTHDDAIHVANRLAEIRDKILPAGDKGIVYGFHIDGSESDPKAAVSYIADAAGFVPAFMNFTAGKFSYGSWKDAFFMPRPCMLKYDGTVDYYLDPEDYSKKEDGTASDVANGTYGGNAMMEWGQGGKKIWYAIVPDAGDNTSASVYIADHQVDERFHAWSFINGAGNYVDHFYTPCYFGTLVNDGTNDVLRSLSGKSGANRCKNKTAAQERAAAKYNNPTGVDIWDTEVYADCVLINLLLVLMGKSLNTQAVFGEGLHTSGSDAVNDSFTSGQHDAKGLFYGTNSGAAGTYTNAVKVFGMENYWGFMWRRMAGLVNVSGTAKYKMTRGRQDGSAADDYVVSTTGSDYAGYLEAGSVPSSSGAYVGQMQFDGNQMVPKTAGGTSMDASHYYCDGLWTNNGQTDYALRGGDSGGTARVGAFCLGLHDAASLARWYYGAAPSCKPLS